jgi:hypothetical protein
MAINWIDDQAAMAIADGLGLTHSTQIVAVADIDRKLSAQNRAREIPLDESRREAISHAYSAGIPMPKIFLRATGSKLVIAGGNHRFSGLPSDTKSLPVHVVACTDAEFEILCRALNTVVGVGMTHRERINASVHAVISLGMSCRAASKIYGASETSVQSGVRKAKADVRIASLVPDTKNRFTQTHLIKIGELANNDNVLRAAVGFVDKTKADTATVAELAAIARQKTTEAEQVAVFTEAAAIAAKSKNAVVPRKVRQTLLKSLSLIESLEGKKTWDSLELDPIEVQSILQRIRKAASILNCLCKANG